MAIGEDSINGLPTELLCKIFYLTIDSRDPPGDLCRLSLVCRLWRECVEGSALLWTDISAKNARTYVRQALERSRGAMINLNYSVHGNPKMTLEAFLVEAAPHTARWRSLRVVASPGSTASMLTTVQAPRLETLALTMRSGAYMILGDTTTLFGGAPAPPTLRHLTLSRVQVAVEPLSLSGLVSLDLSLVTTISTPQLLEILRSSPCLETLRLNDNPRLVALGSQPIAIQSIILPKLVSLSLEGLDHGGANCILSTIRIPNRRSVFIYSDISEVSDQSGLFTSTTTHILHTTIPSSDPQFSDIEVELDDDGDCSIRFRGVKLELWVGGVDQIHEFFTWIVEGLGSEASACPVRLTFDQSGMDMVRMVAVPPPLVVKHLSIPVLFGYIALSQPEFASSQWGCPAVDSLSIELDTMESREQLISMLRSRYGQAASEGEPGLRRPTNLRSVELRGRMRTEGLVEEIMGILGEARVFWANE